MTWLRGMIISLTLGASVLLATAADAAPRILFKGCAYWGVPPFCLMMKATDGKTYQLLNTDPAFPAGYPVEVYANPGPEFGLCFAPTAKVIRWKPRPGKSC